MHSVALIGKTGSAVPTHSARYRFTESANKRMPSDVACSHAADAGCYVAIIQKAGSIQAFHMQPILTEIHFKLHLL